MKIKLDVSDALPEFRKFSEAEVWAALKGEDGDNPLANEVTRLSADYFKKFRAYVRLHGDLPPFEALHIALAFPVERVAVKMMINFLTKMEKMPAATIH